MIQFQCMLINELKITQNIQLILLLNYRYNHNTIYDFIFYIYNIETIIWNLKFFLYNIIFFVILKEDYDNINFFDKKDLI